MEMFAVQKRLDELRGYWEFSAVCQVREPAVPPCLRTQSHSSHGFSARSFEHTAVPGSFSTCFTRRTAGTTLTRMCVLALDPAATELTRQLN